MVSKGARRVLYLLVSFLTRPSRYHSVLCCSKQLHREGGFPLRLEAPERCAYPCAVWSHRARFVLQTTCLTRPGNEQTLRHDEHWAHWFNYVASLRLAVQDGPQHFLAELKAKKPAVQEQPAGKPEEPEMKLDDPEPQEEDGAEAAEDDAKIAIDDGEEPQK